MCIHGSADVICGSSTYQNGRPVRESTGTKNETIARRMLRAREGDVERGIPIDPKVGRITFDEAAEDMLERLQGEPEAHARGCEAPDQKHLAPFFGNRRMITITTTELRAYVAKRLADGTPVRQKGESRAKEKGLYQTCRESRCRPGEINRELTVLKRMFSLAIQAGKLLHKPHFPMLRENNVRAGFFEREQYLAMQRHLAARPCDRS